MPKPSHTLDAIRMLPIDPGVKQQVIQKYDSLGANKQAIDNVGWAAYHQIEAVKTAEYTAMLKIQFSLRAFVHWVESFNSDLDPLFEPDYEEEVKNWVARDMDANPIANVSPLIITETQRLLQSIVNAKKRLDRKALNDILGSRS